MHICKYINLNRKLYILFLLNSWRLFFRCKLILISYLKKKNVHLATMVWALISFGMLHKLIYMSLYSLICNFVCFNSFFAVCFLLFLFLLKCPDFSITGLYWFREKYFAPQISYNCIEFRNDCTNAKNS